MTYAARRPWRGAVALLVIVGIAPGLLMAPPLVVAIAGNLVALCLTLSWRRVTIADRR